MIWALLLCSFFASTTEPVEPIRDWVWQNPLPQGNQLNCVFAFDANRAIAAGQAGTIIMTSDGGQTWTVFSLDLFEEIYEMFFVDANTGWAVGWHEPDIIDHGRIAKTTDGGRTWQSQREGIEDHLVSVYFVDDNTGWVAGRDGVVLKTTNGGQTWIGQNSGSNYTIGAMSFVDANRGWILASSYADSSVRVTTNGGADWERSVSFDDPMEDLTFIDAQTGWVCGDDGAIFHTTDGGQNWNPQTSNTSQDLGCIRFLDRQRGWALGENRTVILSTVNGGDEWVSQLEEGYDGFYGTHFLDQNLGWVVGEYGIIMKLEGGTWSEIRAGTGARFYDSCFIDTNNGWLAAWDGLIFRTQDGGESWASQTSNVTQSLYSIHFVDHNHGWAVGRNRAIVHTVDGGINWATQYCPVDEDLNSVWFLDDQRGFAVGDRATLVGTVDAGASWQVATYTIEINPDFSCIHFVNSEVGYIVGEDGWMMKTTDGGTNWEGVYSNTSMNLEDVHFVDLDHGWAAGQKSTVIRTTDGGNTWSPVQRPHFVYFSDIESIFFATRDVGWVTKIAGEIYKTVDGGDSWMRLDSGTLNNLYACEFLDQNSGWVFGDNGTVLKTTNGGDSSPVVLGSQLEYCYYLPEIAENGQTYVGLVNSGNADAQVEVFSFSDQGQLMGQDENISQLGADEKYWFDASSFTSKQGMGWLQIGSDRELMVYVESSGDEVLSAYLSTDTLDVLNYLPHVAKNTELFETHISSVNASSFAATTTIQARPNGQQAFVDRHGAPFANAHHDVRDFFGEDLSQIDWAEIRSDRSCLASMEYFSRLPYKTQHAALRLDRQSASVINFLHVATNTDLYWTGMVYFNISSNAVDVTESYFDAGGNSIAQRDISLNPNEKMVLLYDHNSMDPVPQGTAWVQVSSEGDLVGYELFGSSTLSTNDHFAGLQANYAQGTKLTFPHFESGLNVWTGLVALNLGNETSDITFTAIDRSGEVLEVVTIEAVTPGTKLAVVLSTLFLNSATLERGAWVRAEASGSAWAGFELWGDQNTGIRKFLAGINASVE